MLTHIVSDGPAFIVSKITTCGGVLACSSSLSFSISTLYPVLTNLPSEGRQPSSKSGTISSWSLAAGYESSSPKGAAKSTVLPSAKALTAVWLFPVPGAPMRPSQRPLTSSLLDKGKQKV